MGALASACRPVRKGSPTTCPTNRYKPSSWPRYAGPAGQWGECGRRFAFADARLGIKTVIAGPGCREHGSGSGEHPRLRRTRLRPFALRPPQSKAPQKSRPYPILDAVRLRMTIDTPGDVGESNSRLGYRGSSLPESAVTSGASVLAEAMRRRLLCIFSAGESLPWQQRAWSATEDLTLSSRRWTKGAGFSRDRLGDTDFRTVGLCRH